METLIPPDGVGVQFPLARLACLASAHLLNSGRSQPFPAAINMTICFARASVSGIPMRSELLTRPDQVDYDD